MKKSKKKIISGFLALSLCLTFLFAFPLTGKAEVQTSGTFIMGDVNGDGAVTIKDATMLQKHLAKMSSLSDTQLFFADVDGDWETTLKDVTTIQQVLAHFDKGNALVGDVINLSGAFSSQIDLSKRFEDNCIAVTIKKEYGHNYSLKDFSEFEFTSMEDLTGYSQSVPMIVVLYLKNPGRDNVIAAINALDYRAERDLMSVEPSYLAIGH
ncbi:MAG: dockerin type I repeat-containing protein [Bacillota bacterium]|nr:dockerin type I repeat-containing protein [Bacillota bacterium]